MRRTAFHIPPLPFPSRTSRPLCRACSAVSPSLSTAGATPRPLPNPKTDDIPHIPVLLSQVLHYLQPPHQTFLDCTIGAGSHAQALLSTGQISRYIGLDKDPHALKIASHTLASYDNVTLLNTDFRALKCTLANADVHAGDIDAILLDVGVSSMQLDTAERGFSFSRDGPLDMRMSCDGVSAADIVNTADESELADIIFALGEDRNSRRIARAIVSARARQPIQTTAQLADVVLSVSRWSRKHAHPATKTFQALRIAVNKELAALEEGLNAGVDMLRVGGRLGVISFHSLEDRIAKRVFKELEHVEGGVRVITKKPVVAEEDEIRANVRSRSAKLRVVERVAPGQTGFVRKVNKYKQNG